MGFVPPAGRPVDGAGGALGANRPAADRASRERLRHRVGRAPGGHAATLGDGRLGQGRLGRGAPRHLDPVIGTRDPGRERPGRPRPAPALIATPGTGSPHKYEWIDAAWSGLRPLLSLPLPRQGDSQHLEPCRSWYEAWWKAAISPRPRRHCVDRRPVVGLRFGTCRRHRVGGLADCRDRAARRQRSGRPLSRRHHHGCRCATR
jgi:hypothetical protein